MKRSDKHFFKPALVSLLASQVIMGMLLFPTAGLAASVMLDWDPSTDPDLAGYKIYYQANSATVPFAGTGATQGGAPVDVANNTTTTISGLDAGSTYYFAVTAYNSAGVESAYSNIVEISESLPPAVSVTPPTSSIVSGTVAIGATASDNIGVTKVEFYVNDILQSTDTAAPYSFTWDTASFSNGNYTVMAKAYDAAGNVGESGNVVLAIAGDTVPPTVSVTAPGNNATVKGTVTVSANATDNISVTKVELYDNGVMVFASNGTPANYSWNTESSANGLHVLSARAYDAAGNVGESANIGITVSNDLISPSIAISSPAASANIAGTVNVAANATDDFGVTKVEFYVDGVLKGTDTAAPYTFAWNTSTVANGSYTLTTKAYDAAGNVGESNGVAVNVSNITSPVTSDTTAPTITILAPTSSYIYSSSVNVSASATDNVRVTRMEVYIDNVLKYTTTSSSFNIKPSIQKGVHTISVKAYDAANNVKVSSKTVNRFL